MFTLVMESPQNFGQTDGYKKKSVAELAPDLFRVIPKKVSKKRTVSQAFLNRS